MPLHFMAWEKKGNGGGALDVSTASFRGMVVVLRVGEDFLGVINERLIIRGASGCEVR